MDIEFGAYYTSLNEDGSRTNDVYKCVAVATDWLQTHEDVVMFVKVGKDGTAGDLLFTSVEEFLANFEII